MSTQSPSRPTMQPGQAAIADRRFQHYEGKRLGVGYSFVRLYVHSLGWALGLKRSARYKIVPAIVLLAAFLPSAVIVVVAAVAPPGTPLPHYYELYTYTLPATYIFIALTMPELICPDRRHGTLRMYMTSNMVPPTYVAAKVAAGWSVLAIVTVLPVVVVFAGYSLLGHGEASIPDWFKTLGEVVGAGLELALFYGTIALALSSLTDRNSFASAGIILTFILSGAALGILQGPLQAPDWVLLVNVNQLPAELMLKIYQADVSGQAAMNIPTWQMAAAGAGWVISGLAVLAFRYRVEGRR